jgi:hypothetical protein
VETKPPAMQQKGAMQQLKAAWQPRQTVRRDDASHRRRAGASPAGWVGPIDPAPGHFRWVNGANPAYGSAHRWMRGAWASGHACRRSKGRFA